MEVKYYVCNHCGNIIEMVKDKGVPVADFCLCDGEQVEMPCAMPWIMEMLSIDIVGLTGACSYALDCIEAELVNITNKHGKRVAYISIRMAEYWKIQGDELQDLAMCALLHDNALTQYISEELKKDSVIDLKKDLSEEKTNLHCIYGEKNITKLPFKTDVSNVILYHHEHADGTGPFQKKWNEIPLFARIIHLADIIDIIRNSIDSDDNSWDFMCQYLSQNKDSLFDSECVNAFLHVFTKESFMCLSDDSFETKLWEAIPREKLVLIRKYYAKMLQISLQRLLIINLLLQADIL